MSSTTDTLRKARLGLVADSCAEETGRYFSDQVTDSSPCYELFRRAFTKKKQDGFAEQSQDVSDEENQDPSIVEIQDAWAEIIRVYGGEVAGWISKHPQTLRSNRETQEYVNRTFARFWQAVSNAEFERFRDLRALLAYLKMCAHSVIMEDARRANILEHAVALDDLADSSGGDPPAPADTQTERVVLANETKRAVREAVNARLKNKKERLVVHCLFELGLKPKAIYAQHPDVFADVDDINDLRQNVLARLSRDPVIRRLAGDKT